ncbi:hypothetical protein [Haloferax volcanii]|uniref:hypothetical protein n=1 Tax=Haloferax volcanii TaxID=2246 RepID=UPI001EF8388F|nr:hypothetical protein [Haloferax alexandrinus]
MSIVSPLGATRSVLTDWPTLMKWTSSVPLTDATVWGVCVVAVGVDVGVAAGDAVAPVSTGPPAPEQPAMKTRRTTATV